MLEVSAPQLLQRATLGIAALALAILSFSVAGAGTREVARWQKVLRPENREVIASLTSDTTEIAFVVITSASCSASRDPQLPRQLDSLQFLVRAEASRRSAIFSTIGVATDRIAAEGIGALGRLGYFDEISAGRSLFSSGAQHYMVSDLTGIPATPQVVVVSRSLGGASGNLITNETVLARIVGLNEIDSWLKAGAPLNRATTLVHSDSEMEGRTVGVGGQEERAAIVRDSSPETR